MLATEVEVTGTEGPDVMVEIAEVLAKRNGTVATKDAVAVIGAIARAVAGEVVVPGKVPGKGTQEAAVEDSLRSSHEESRT